MKSKVFIIALAACCLLIAATAEANHYESARSLSMGKSYTSLARNYHAIGVNPANLALSGGNNLSVELFSVGADINNNSFSLSDYNSYNGEHLSDADKDDILSKIPDKGLEGSAETGVSAFSFSRGSIAFGVTGHADGKAKIDKQIVELIFNGNTIGDTVDISNAYGTGTAHVDFNLSYARKLKDFGWGSLNWGINLKYIYGIQYANVEEADAYILTTAQGIESEGAVSVKTSEGGSGFGVDLGLSAEYGNNWVFSMALSNILSSISWSDNNKLNTYVFTWENLTVDNSDDDSVITSDDYEESIGSFSESLPPQLVLGASTTYSSLLLSFDYKQGFKDQGRVSTTPEISVGCEAGFFKTFPLRAGFSLGGAEGSSAAVGFGVKLSPFFIDFAYMSTGSLAPIGGKGMGLAVSSGLHF